MSEHFVTMDGNEAAAHVAYRTNEVIAIYPITPASPMGEWSDLWSSQDQANIWGTTPRVIEMQAEGGAAGAVHGALQSGALTTTFTASQGLLLMIPNMYKIAGELTGTVFHIAARSLAAQALSIFGDHSDVMAARGAGWAMLFSGNVQEVLDLALISQAATLQSRIPFLHIFDGFRTSHELKKIDVFPDDVIREMIRPEWVEAHRSRGMSPDNPFIRGTAQNPDVYFQARESVNPFYTQCISAVCEQMDRFAALTGRTYRPFEYTGSPTATRVVVIMGSGAETARETATWLHAHGEDVGVVTVRLYRPFSTSHFLDVLPESVTDMAVLDRTKEPGSNGEPLFQDIVTALASRGTPMPRMIGGRYGLSSKEFTPAMVKAVFEALREEKPPHPFVVGIHDDVSNNSLSWDPSFDILGASVTQAVFWGLGSDGTVGANKNSIKIIGEQTPFHAQGYFVYDSKKAGARTISHLRFGPDPINAPWLIDRAQFVAVHQFGFLERYNTLEMAAEGGTFLLNSPHGPETVWSHLPRPVQEQIIQRRLRFFVVDAYALAAELNLGVRINTIMQAAFFHLAGILPPDEAIAQIKAYIRKTYGKRGEAIVRQNNEAVDAAISHLFEVTVPGTATSMAGLRPPVPSRAPSFVQSVTAEMIAGRGDDLPVSTLPVDGTYPSGTTQWEKRNIAMEIPEWDPDLCIQCGKCVLVCPHAVIRANVVPNALLAGSPEGFQSLEASWRGLEDHAYTLQVSSEDCTGCQLCVEVCPAKDKSHAGRKALNMIPNTDQSTEHWEFFTTLDPISRTSPLSFSKVKDVQLMEPLFEFSSACSGCGETPYLKLATQLFGDRMVVANATGCSSIYGGNLPTTPWARNRDGRGPAWNNSLFEDNAEFGLGMRISLDKQAEYARELLGRLREPLGSGVVQALLDAQPISEEEIAAQRDRIRDLKTRLSPIGTAAARDLMSVADALVPRSVWIIGGDGWAYDIGFGGLDHVLASGRNVNVLVLDTEVYSNTGGQASKATGLGAVAKFAAGGKAMPKKDLGLIAVNYGYVYVAQVAMGANDNQTIKAFREAEAYDGPSLIIAYSHCIAHGIDMTKGLEQQDLATRSGHWPLYRFDPRLQEERRNPFQLDSKKPSIPLTEYLYNENRYRILTKINPDQAARFARHAQTNVNEKWKRYESLAKRAEMSPEEPGKTGLPPAAGPPSKPGLPPTATLPPKPGRTP
ncbi:MAG: pyruvate:ferredoxin (flavodoxin) oxidoreductase [Rhodothermales bacterium]